MKPHTFHLLGLAHQPVTDRVPSCAYTMKVVNMAKMLKRAGHRVFVYGPTGISQGPYDEYVPVVPQEVLRSELGNNYENTYNDGNVAVRCWKEFTRNAVRQISRRLSDEDDIILASYGSWHARACPSEEAGIIIEMGIGYEGIFARRKVFESYAWQHYMYAKQPWTDSFRHMDEVIPNYLDPDKFEFGADPEKYVLYLGRVQQDKGVLWAYYAAQATGHKLAVIGPGDHQWIQKNMPEAIYVGMVGVQERRKYLSRAKALLCPTLYLEPFGGVAIEAAYSGTPVISADWGGFTETVLNGQTGFRVRTSRQAAQALASIDKIDRQVCHEWGKNFTLESIWPRYERYFERILEDYRQNQ